ncbi:MAG: SGNH/GDSL hydrolase family protein [Bacteroidetes bacterium]|nr:SGNH/GDSL hydrolase family protein [Bacteroidota bacterium]
MKYLALGDSYTIGEQVDFIDNFPNQLVKLLQEAGIQIQLNQLIAVTGWTTDELAASIAKEKPECNYDLVTLLIGVNNQYRGRSLDEYYWQFYSLLCQAILFAKSKASHVVVLSIPDWGLTPFNTTKDKIQMSTEIDEFNRINAEITQALGCHYFDITTSTRLHANDVHFLAADQLHYSAKEYAIWAEMMYTTCVSILQNQPH